MLARHRTSPLPELTPGSAAEIETAEACYAIGLVPYTQGRWTDALQWFRRAMELQAHYMPAVLMAAEASLRLGHSRDALEFAGRVLNREPLNADALIVAGHAAEALGAPDQALSFFQQAASQRPDDAGIRQALLRLTP